MVLGQAEFLDTIPKAWFIKEKINNDLYLLKTKNLQASKDNVWKQNISYSLWEYICKPLYLIKDFYVENIRNTKCSTIKRCANQFFFKKANYLNDYLTKEDTWMAIKHMKKKFQLVIKKMKINIFLSTR